MYIPLPNKVHIPQTKGGAKAFALMWRIKHIQNGTCLTPTWSKSCVVKLKNKFIEINPTPAQTRFPQENRRGVSHTPFT